LTVFRLEGLSVAVVGSIFGATGGTTLVYLLSLIEQPVTRAGQTPEPLFPAFISPAFILVSMLAAIVATVLAALLPARRAARLNAVDVMR
jgi:lipoprotein-releasing system permease protein